MAAGSSKPRAVAAALTAEPPKPEEKRSRARARRGRRRVIPFSSVSMARVYREPILMLRQAATSVSDHLLIRCRSRGKWSRFGIISHFYAPLSATLVLPR